MTYKMVDDGIGGPQYIFDEGGIWEDKEVAFERDYEVSPCENSCRHMKNGRIPLVIIATNEGGHNTTGICAQCVMEAIKELEDAQ